MAKRQGLWLAALLILLGVAQADNLALGRPVLASSAAPDAPGSLLVDGRLDTAWNAGDYAPATVEIDLGAPYYVDEVRLHVRQTPDGLSEHRIWLGDAAGQYRLGRHFGQYTADGDLLRFAAGQSGVRYIKVETLGSNSWVSWREIEVEGQASPFAEMAKAPIDPLDLTQQPTDPGWSQYSPWVMHQPGWASYLIYYCKNAVIDGKDGDAVWRTESYSGGWGEWINDQVVVRGTEIDAPDDLSCSPGVVIDGNGVWHMYYVVSPRTAPLDHLRLYHATAAAPGLVWHKHGEIVLPDRASLDYIETPSPFYLNGRIVLYYVGTGQTLYRAESEDGHHFSAPQPVPTPRPVSHGRVSRDEAGAWYYSYSTHPDDVYLPPSAIYLASSNDGLAFHDERPLFSAFGGEWDSIAIWSPMLWHNTSGFRLYYAGSKIPDGVWWGEGSILGVRDFARLPAAAPKQGLQETLPPSYR
ncbi:discoidin domain-containing protein [Chitinimonas lacunae]|uniref:Discoidin domain-containing protein n=1 Tax=Chitinimonas lacunae TaxID=1963018 RepID=A0ABV8MR21_9NEIS